MPLDATPLTQSRARTPRSAPDRASVARAPTFAAGGCAFQRDVRARVDAHFAGRSTTGGFAMGAKVAFWLAALALSWCAAVLVAVHPALTIVCWAAVGFAIACIGFNVGHDAIHGSLSRRPWVNEALSWSFDLIGASSATWRIAHNLVHHTYTNVPGVDGDLEPGPFLRFYPQARLHPWHRLQHLFAWPLYTLIGVIWVYVKDFEQMLRPHPRTGARAPASTWLRLFAGKLAHVTLFLAVPLLISPSSALVVVAGYVVLLLVAGFTLAIVFQLAHVVEGVAFPAVDDGKLDGAWMEHQLLTTADFGRSRLCTFITGGLDHQIEHHLFPRVCHVHYRELAPIVAQCARDHGLHALHSGSFIDAVRSHARMLRTLGAR